MNITKFGHCCLLLETNEKRILIDPGKFSEAQNELCDIDIILITHEHADHYHSESVMHLVTNNPDAIIVTNTSVAALLKTLDVEAYVLEGNTSTTVADIFIEALDGPHVEIFEEFGLVQNTGYFVNNTFFFPGDAYTLPFKPVKILALPVAGPWCKASDAVRYALLVKPHIAIPVHDATLSKIGQDITYGLCARELTKQEITFIPLVPGVPKNFTS